MSLWRLKCNTPTLDKSQQIYRITYEAFSQFSSSLARVDTLEELKFCLQSRLKYLFDYRFMRISSYLNQKWAHLEVAPTHCKAHFTSVPHLYPHEKQLILRQIPQVWEQGEIELNAEIIPEKEAYKVWGWHQQGKSNHMTLTLVADAHQSFIARKVPFIKLFIEILETKLLQLLLFQEIENKNQELSEALVTIQEKNSEINSIIDHQDEVIKQQTEYLAQQNKQLRRIAVLNAHQVREPLSRILGLIQISEHMEIDELKTEIFPRLHESSSELDKSLKKVITTAEKPLNPIILQP